MRSICVRAIAAIIKKQMNSRLDRFVCPGDRGKRI